MEYTEEKEEHIYSMYVKIQLFPFWVPQSLTKQNTIAEYDTWCLGITKW